MTLAPTYLIYRTGFAPTNGTSVQMSRLWAGSEESLVHLMWDDHEAGGDSVPSVVRVDDDFHWERPFRRAAKIARQTKGLFFAPWWKAGKLNLARLKKALSKVYLHPRQAYVSCYCEYEAVKAHALWDAVGRPPFILHLFDLLDPELSETTTPFLARLARAADEVLCLNRLLEDEARRGGATKTSLFPLVSDLEVDPRKAPPMPLKILMSGALYSNVLSDNHAMELLVEVWPRVKKLYPDAELHYSGTASWGLPAGLRPHVQDHGFLASEDYQRLLQSCHVAYVPVSHRNHTSFRFSMPSRIPDYLIQGLPVMASTDENSAIDDFFKMTPRECSRIVGTADEFLAGLQDFAADPRRWEEASGVAIDYSKKTFALASARESLLGKLNAAGSKTEATA